MSNATVLIELKRFDSWQSTEIEHVSSRGDEMLSWALTFLVLAIIAAVFGFGGIAAGATQIAQILFFLFLVMFVVSLITGGLRGRTSV